MTVYVDDMRARYGRMILCYMVADTAAELHAMADRIGVARRWYHGDHYCIALDKRAFAVSAGAVEITCRECGIMMMHRRKYGELMPLAQVRQHLADLAAKREARAAGLPWSPMPMPDAPRRIQRRRTQGWRMPDGAIYVGRPTRWGNPFPVDGGWIVWAAVAAGFRADRTGRLAASLAFYREWLTGAPAHGPAREQQSGDTIVYESGIAMDTADAARQMAADFAWINRSTLSVQTAPTHGDMRRHLRGKDLVCWCALDCPCHADVLLELANA